MQRNDNPLPEVDMKPAYLKLFFVCTAIFCCTIVFSEDYKYFFSTDNSGKLSFRRSYHDSHSAVKYFREFSFNKRRSLLLEKNKRDKDFLFVPDDTSSEGTNSTDRYPSEFELNQLHDAFLSEAINSTASSASELHPGTFSEHLPADNATTSNSESSSKQ